ncbi:MAG: hypothetical protein MZU95_02190 [Desulfomicrobium escambiense]|nr:hypothetical protein [Desulfomicrobium escambiense]
MKRSPRSPVMALALAALVLVSGTLGAQTPPDKFLGHRVGEDRKLADYTQIKAYFEKLAQESNRIKLFTIGESVLKKPIIMAAISTPGEPGQARPLEGDHPQAPRPPDDARRRGPQAGQGRQGHRPHHLLPPRHRDRRLPDVDGAGLRPGHGQDLLRRREDPRRRRRPARSLATTPTATRWSSTGTRNTSARKYEGGNMPWLYHHYAGHDNNRDWYMFNLPETRAVTKVLYHDWLPQIHVDEHQQGSNGARLFVPPFMDPPLPNIQPSVWRGVNLVGTEMSLRPPEARPERRRQRPLLHGLVDRRLRRHVLAPQRHRHPQRGGLGPRWPAPSTSSRTSSQTGYHEKRMDFVDPWPGGWWRLRDLVDYELVLSKSMIKTAGLHKEDFLFNFYQMYKNSVEKVEPGQPYAFVIPAVQRDYPTMLKMLEVLKTGGVEIHQAKADFIAGGRLYNGRLVRGQDGPALQDLRLGPARKAEISGHAAIPRRPARHRPTTTPPGPCRCRWASSATRSMRPSRPSSRRSTPSPTPRSRPRARAGLLRPRRPGQRLLRRGRRPAQGRGRGLADEGQGRRSRATSLQAGSFIVKNAAAVKKALPALAEKLDLAVLDVDDVSGLAKDPVKFPRIGLFQSWRGNMDEGWTRYVFDDLGIPYKTLHNADIKGAKDQKVDLRADLRRHRLRRRERQHHQGHPARRRRRRNGRPNRPWPAWFRQGPVPPEYEGGIGQEGVDALKAFVEKGGRAGRAQRRLASSPSAEFGAPARNILTGVDRAKFFCPTSILRILVDNETPIGYGMPKEAAAMFVNSLAFDTFSPVLRLGPQGRGHLSRGRDPARAAGCSGEEYLARKAAVVDTKYKEGRIILIGDPLPEPGPVPRDLQVPAERPALSGDVTRCLEKIARWPLREPPGPLGSSLSRSCSPDAGPDLPPRLEKARSPKN